MVDQVADTSSAQQYASQVQAASNATGVPQAILFGVMQQESQFNPTAQPVNTNGSIDYGLMGLNSNYYGTFGATATAAQQVQQAAEILAADFKSTGSWQGALAAYNAGLTGASNGLGQAYASAVSALAQGFAAMTGETIQGLTPSPGAALPPSVANIPLIGPFLTWAANNVIPLGVGVSCAGLVLFGVYALIVSPSAHKAA